jgi:RND family efflux transporter MFP subunit
VLTVEVVPGDRVTAGQRLLVLDGRDLDARRHQADASIVAFERAAAAAAADRDAAGAALTLARATHGRLSALHARRSATAHELDEAVAALDGADARLRSAEARVAEVGAALEAGRAAAADAAVTAGFAVLTAPFGGVVTETLVDPGNLAGIGVPLLRIDDTRSFRLETRIDESRAATVAAGDPVHVLLGAPNASGTRATVVAGRVAEIARAVDAATHAFLVKIDLPAHPGLRSGMFARARFGAGSREALVVPRAAMVPQGQLSTVFVVAAQGRARMRVVRTGESDRDRVEVVAGVAPGELVVVAPPPGLRDGDPVRSAASAVPAPAGGQ